MGSNKIESFKLTFEAIQQVRIELAQCASAGDDIKARDCLNRLSTLYASMDAKSFVDCINEMESQINVIKVDFQKKAS